MKTWHQIGFQPIQSQDGSPTLRPYPDGQSMHHLGGALSESVFIYDQAIAAHLSRPSRLIQEPVGIFVLGLGLAYIELLTLKRVILMGIPSNQVFMRSHESEAVLIENISRFLVASNHEPDDEIMATYSKVLTEICRTNLAGVELEIAEQLRLHDDIKRMAREFLKTRQWEICGALNENSPELQAGEKQFHVICFDAYSEKASPELWTEALLDQLIERLCAPNCVFATYACTGKLTRSLKKAGFLSLRKEGFKGKRNSTLMTRNSLSLVSL